MSASQWCWWSEFTCVNCKLWIWKFNRLKWNSWKREWDRCKSQIVQCKLHSMPDDKSPKQKSDSRNCIKSTEAELFCCVEFCWIQMFSMLLQAFAFSIFSSFFGWCTYQFDHNEIVCKMHARWMWIVFGHSWAMIHDLTLMDVYSFDFDCLIQQFYHCTLVQWLVFSAQSALVTIQNIWIVWIQFRFGQTGDDELCGIWFSYSVWFKILTHNNHFIRSLWSERSLQNT